MHSNVLGLTKAGIEQKNSNIPVYWISRKKYIAWVRRAKDCYINQFTMKIINKEIILRFI